MANPILVTGAAGRVGAVGRTQSMHRAIAGCESMYLGMSVSDDYLAATSMLRQSRSAMA